jgi:hypothetical protein
MYLKEYFVGDGQKRTCVENQIIKRNQFYCVLEIRVQVPSPNLRMVGTRDKIGPDPLVLPVATPVNGSEGELQRTHGIMYLQDWRSSRKFNTEECT